MTPSTEFGSVEEVPRLLNVELDGRVYAVVCPLDEMRRRDDDTDDRPMPSRHRRGPRAAGAVAMNQRWRDRRDTYRPAGEPIDTSRYGGDR